MRQRSGCHVRRESVYSAAMTDDESQSIYIHDADRNRFHATWSRSMKSLIVTVGPSDPSGRKWRQVLLDPDQTQQLRDFLTETLPT